MYTKDNIELGKIHRTNVICIYVDVRDSVKINEKYSNNSYHLLSFYCEMINQSYDIFVKNGFENIEIQGDEIYGLFDIDNCTNYFNSVSKCINELDELISKLYNNYKIKCTISINKGEEYYSAFGYDKNNKKQLAFFGNVVSKTKKMNSLSRNAKIVISNTNFTNSDISTLLKNKKVKKLYLKFGKKVGKVSLHKWN